MIAAQFEKTKQLINLPVHNERGHQNANIT